MRRRLKDMRVQSAQRGAPLSRLVPLFVMLAVVSMVYVRLRDRNTYRWITDRPQSQQTIDSVEKPLAAPLSSAVGSENGSANSGADDSSATVHEPQLVQADVSGSAANATSQPATPQPVPSKSTASQPAAVSSPPADTTAPATSKSTTATSTLMNSTTSAKANGSLNQPTIVPETENLTPVKPPAAVKSPALPSATGPTDEDEDERAFIDEARLAIKDSSFHTTPAEMAAYDHVLQWTERQPLERLIGRAKRGVLYDQFMSDPESLRFKLIDVTLNVRQIVPNPYKTQSGATFYELRGFTTESGQLLYMGMVTGIPPGMPIGEINEQVRLVGYFFKKQGYASKASLMQGKKLVAPLIVGRIMWLKTDAPGDASSFPIWAVVSFCAVVGIGVALWVFLVGRSSKPLALPPMRATVLLDSEGPSVDNWLDQAQSGRLDDRDSSIHGLGDDENLENGGYDAQLGNRFGQNGESNPGHGHSDAEWP